jgi:ferritin-like metal-binding protein YciE
MSTRLGSRFAELTHSLSHGSLFGRARQQEQSTAPAVASTREALNDRWREIRAGIGNGSAIDNLESFYRHEIEELRSAETQACALADEMWVTMLNGPLAERVSQYVLELRRRAAEHESLSDRPAGRARTHANQAMRALVQDASRLAEVCAPNVRDAALLAALQHIIHYLIASYGSIAAHAKALGRAEEATMFASHADSDQELDAELSTLAKDEVNPQAVSAGESPH